ncbi:MAG TPA: AAA family ATPase [Pirellulales bacterium]|nr:AAA family ATPase [Pirellulales bacterium]
MPMLKRIRIAGWKSIKDQAIDLQPLNVVIGANGAGKSNLLSFFQLLRAVSLNDVARLVARAGGASAVLHHGPKTTSAIVGEMEFSAELGLERHEFRLAFAGGDKLIFDSESFSEPKAESPQNKVHHRAVGGQFPRASQGGEIPDGEPAATIHRRLSGIRVYHFHDTSETARARLAGYVEDNRGLSSDAGNLPAILYLLRNQYGANYRRITGAVRSVMPDFDDLVLEPQQAAPQNILLNWRQKESDYLFGPHQFSDGSLRFIALATLLNQPAELLPSVIVIDEPELGLHPAALSLLGGMLRSVSHRCQVVVATQSVALLDEFQPDEVIVAEMHRSESQFRQLDSGAIAEWLETYSLSQLWEKNVIGGGPFG